MAFLTIACPCLFGLESVLSGEVKRMGGQDVEVTDGRVCFKGNPRMVARANVLLRTAERVLIVVGGFRAETFQDLFEGVYHLPWENFIGSRDAFPVKGWSLNSKLRGPFHSWTARQIRRGSLGSSGFSLSITEGLMKKRARPMLPYQLLALNQ